MSVLTRMFSRLNRIIRPAPAKRTANPHTEATVLYTQYRKVARPAAQPGQTLMGKAAIQSLPSFTGLEINQIEVVLTETGAVKACAALRAAQIVGFDTESKPIFTKTDKPHQGPHLIQLCTQERAYLFPVRHNTLPTPLRELLADPKVIKTGFDLRSDLALLKTNHQLQCDGVRDLVPLFRRSGYRNTIGAVQAVALLFGQYYRKSKSAKMSNWAAPTLNESQQRYAANDAYVPLRVYMALRTRRREGLAAL